MRRLLVLPLLFAGVFVATYVATSATGNSVALAVLATFVVGVLWIVAHDVRRTPWPSESQRSHDAAYAAAAFAVLHAPGQSGTECPTGFDSFGGCGDGGA